MLSEGFCPSQEADSGWFCVRIGTISRWKLVRQEVTEATGAD